MTFLERNHDFGKIKKGDKGVFTYKFKNTGDAPLVIELISGCECTDIEWPEGETFQPGEGGEIKVTFVSSREEKSGQLEKTIDILIDHIDPDTTMQVFEILNYTVYLED